MSDNTSPLLALTSAHATSYLAGIAGRPVGATATADDLRAVLGAGDLPDRGVEAAAVVDDLARAAERGTVATQGPRFFGFVVGGSLPAATAADWLVSTWDQNAGLFVLSPLVSVVEEIAGDWMRDIIGVPRSWSIGYVTGCQMANFTALATSRHHVLRARRLDRHRCPQVAQCAIRQRDCPDGAFRRASTRDDADGGLHRAHGGPEGSA